MTANRTDPSLKDLDRGLLVAASVLIAVGAATAASGSAMLALAVLRAGRRWMQRADLPPAELAKLKWSQARAAAGAGAGAWRDAEPSGT